MMLSRKLFLSSLAAAGVGFRRAWADSAAKPIVTFGVMSDSHVKDDPETIGAYARLLNGAPGLTRVDLLPYHASSGGKYALLGLAPPAPLPERPIPDEFLTLIPRARKIIS